MFRFVVLFLLLSQAYSYLLPQQAAMGALSRPSLARRQGVVALRAKGFADKPKPREKSEGQIKREVSRRRSNLNVAKNILGPDPTTLRPAPPRLTPLLSSV